jgi:OPT family oligopeptide transporter
MALFQKPPTTPEEIEHSKPLDLPPDQVVELEEEEWYVRAYRGDDTPQLTWRAALMGMALGFFLAFTNVYLGLKVGLHLAVALTACVLSFSIWGFLSKTGMAKTPMSILENNCMQSTASAAGYSTGSTIISAVPAMLLLSATPEHPEGQQLPWPVLAGWTFFLAFLGVVLAIPMKRNLINQEKLKFPSGTAAAVLLQSLYTEGKEALIKARALLVAGSVAGLLPLLKDLEILRSVDDKGKTVRDTLLPASVKIFDWLPGIAAAGKAYPLSAWNIKFDYDLAVIAAGALVGVRATLSMIAGGLVLAIGIGPAAMAADWTNPAGVVVHAVNRPQSAWKEIGVWFGAPMLVAAGLLSFAFQWKTIVKAFQGLVAKRPSGEGSEAAQARLDRSASIEVPNRWFALGGALATAGVVAIAWRYFEIPPHFGLLAVVMTFFLSLVASRVTGETDVTPTGAMGKMTQLTYGVLIPQNTTANLMTAAITAGAASASADLLNDLKSGYLLGANPRRQFIAQFLGVFPGTVATVIGYYLLVPNATALTGIDGRDPAFPAPAAQQWKTVAQVFKLGIENLHPMAQSCIFWGLIVGIAVTLLERALPKQKKYLPSAMGLGLGMILPYNICISMFIGAAIAAFVGRNKESRAAELVIPVASGLIAGQSVVGVIVAGINNFVLR